MRAFIPLLVNDLEPRLVPAGNVKIIESPQEVRIQGDPQANEITVTQNTFGDGTVTIAGVNATTINGGTDPVTINVAGKRVRIEMFGGDDKVKILGSAEFKNDLVVNLGNGTNLLGATGGELRVNGNLQIIQEPKSGAVQQGTVDISSKAGDKLTVTKNFSYVSTKQTNDNLVVGKTGENSTVGGDFSAVVDQGKNVILNQLASVGGKTVIFDRSLPFETVSLSFDVFSTSGDVSVNTGKGITNVQYMGNQVGGDFNLLGKPSSSYTANINASGIFESYVIRVGQTGKDPTSISVNSNIGTLLGDFATNVKSAGTVNVVNAAGFFGGNFFHSSSGNGGNVSYSIGGTAKSASIVITGAGVVNGTLGNVLADAKTKLTGVGSATTDTGDVGAKAKFEATKTNNMSVNYGNVAGLLQTLLKQTDGFTLQVDKAGAMTITAKDAGTQNKVIATEVTTNLKVTTSAKATGGLSTDITIDSTNVKGKISITSTGNSANVFVVDCTFDGDLDVKALASSLSAFLMSKSKVGGTTSIKGGGKITSVSLDDVILHILKFVGGGGRDFLEVDTSSSFTGQSVMDSVAILMGGNDDEVTFGGKLPDQSPDPARKVTITGGIRLVGSGGTNTFFNNNSSFDTDKFKSSSFDIL